MISSLVLPTSLRNDVDSQYPYIYIHHTWMDKWMHAYHCTSSINQFIPQRTYIQAISMNRRTTTIMIVSLLYSICTYRVFCIVSVEATDTISCVTITVPTQLRHDRLLTCSMCLLTHHTLININRERFLCLITHSSS